VALDLAGGAARQLRERDEADVLGLLVAGEIAAASGIKLVGAEALVGARDHSDRHLAASFAGEATYRTLVRSRRWARYPDATARTVTTDLLSSAAL
jgi:hypothetical protein